MEFKTEVMVDLKNLPPFVKITYGDEAGTKTEILCAQHFPRQLLQSMERQTLVPLDQLADCDLKPTDPLRLYLRWQPVHRIEALAVVPLCPACRTQ